MTAEIPRTAPVPGAATQIRSKSLTSSCDPFAHHLAVAGDATLHILKICPIHFFTGALAISAANTCVSPNMFARKTTHFLSGVMLTFGSPSLP